MTTDPIDTEALRKQYAHLVEKYGPEAWAESRAHVVLSLLEALAAAEHRATRAEAQSAIRGRAVAIHRERAKDAEGWAALWKETARRHIEGERFADAHIDKWRQWGKRLHETHMAEVRDREARIKAVRELHAEVEGLHCYTVCSHRSCIDDSGDQHRYPCPTIRALDGSVTPPDA